MDTSLVAGPHDQCCVQMIFCDLQASCLTCIPGWITCPQSIAPMLYMTDISSFACRLTHTRGHWPRAETKLNIWSCSWKCVTQTTPLRELIGCTALAWHTTSLVAGALLRCAIISIMHDVLLLSNLQPNQNHMAAFCRLLEHVCTSTAAKSNSHSC